MGAVAIPLVFDDVRLAQLPMNNALTHVLAGEGKRQAAACSFAGMNVGGAVDFCLIFEGVFVVLRILKQCTVALAAHLLGKALGYHLLACVQLFDRKQAARLAAR